MAINYSKVNWDTTKSLGPTNFNRMDKGIKSACDGVDNISSTYAKLSNANTFTKGQFVDNNVYWGVTATNGEKRGGITIDNNNDYMIATGGISSGENKRNIYIGSTSAVDKIYLQSTNGVSLPLVKAIVTNSTYGITLTFNKIGRFVFVNCYSNKTNTNIACSSGYVNIAGIPSGFEPESTDLIYAVSGAYRIQLRATSDKKFQIGYSSLLSTNTPTDIPSGSLISAQRWYISAT